MRSVELQSAAASDETPAPSPSSKPELSHEERKTLMRAVSQAEKKIERLESKMNKIEVEMAKPEFYNRSDAAKVMQEHGQLKKDVETAMEDWEKAQEAWEPYS